MFQTSLVDSPASLATAVLLLASKLGTMPGASLCSGKSNLLLRLDLVGVDLYRRGR